MSNDHVYEGLAIGWLSDINAEDSTRDGEPPTGKEIAQWVEDWLAEANEFMNKGQ